MHPRLLTLAAVALLLAAPTGCRSRDKAPALNRQATAPDPQSPALKAAADGPRLGSVANVTPILEQPNPKAKILGYLHAGSTVARTQQAVSSEGCKGGWYAVYPKGFVCTGEAASLDLKHPTLLAMAMQPKLDAELPYTYARTRDDTSYLEASAKAEDSVRSLSELPRQSGLAVIGSWQARDEKGSSLRLAMMTDGHFVDAEHLETNKASTFKGVQLDDQQRLPLAFVVKRGVRQWEVGKNDARKGELLDYHARVMLDGKVRSVQGERFWAARDGGWVRNRDVTVIQTRSEFPSFVQDDTRWIDVSVLAGSIVLYEGKRPVYASLVSVGQDRLGDPNGDEATLRGEFPIVFKHVTAVAADPARFANKVEMHDVPWVLELSSGQWLHGAYWHDRFGIEHGPGNIQLSPADAAWVWRWAGPALPSGWHGIASDRTAAATIVNIRR
ncbi:MAG TPA: L,D-transpeptidase [Polyangiaceae bacterium]|nr:L,D-transpeptidase [Polyangiaceae bacterium]